MPNPKVLILFNLAVSIPLFPTPTFPSPTPTNLASFPNLSRD